MSSGADRTLNAVERSFPYMPYMHSESRAIHAVAVELFRRNGIPGNLDFELKHMAIIERFGRYPHRNAILGRASTPEEIEFLKQPGSDSSPCVMGFMHHEYHGRIPRWHSGRPIRTET